MASTIKESSLRELIDADSVLAARAVGQPGGFSLIVQCGSAEKVLLSTRGEPRVFALLDTLAEYLRRMGITQFDVDTTGFQPGRVRAARPDRAVALRATRTTPRQQPLI